MRKGRLQRSMRLHLWGVLCCSVAGCGVFAVAARADVTLADNGSGKATIYTTARVMAPDDPAINTEGQRTPPVVKESQRRELREAVKDLAHYLGQMSGATFPVSTEVAAGGTIPIYIGERAVEVFGPPKQSAFFKQGFRVVVGAKGIGLEGESDLATSYAVYEVLDRLGCRWFMPTEMGECVPTLKTINLADMDFSSAPFTYYRGVWYGDAAFQRRNRMGGYYLAASHALDSILPASMLKEHPDWVAIYKGKPAPPTIKWTKPEIADALAATLLQRLDKSGPMSLSLSPEDGMTFDESEDPKFDAGDFDPVLNTTSITDRLLMLDNRVAAKVSQKYPDVLMGFIAYVNYTRPPVREPVHPNLVPEIAPITYTRYHPITDMGEPNNQALRDLIVGWGKKARMTAAYMYGYNLCEITAPFPMIKRWSEDTLFLFHNNCKFWAPETEANYETSMYGIYIANRLAWDPTLKPQDIVDDINTRFYGNAAKEMGEYWSYIDDLWNNTPEYSGGANGYLLRFTPERMKHMRELLNAGKAKARTPQEKERVTLANESLVLFEKYMKMRWDFAEGRFDKLDSEADTWVRRTDSMAERYRAQSCFSTRRYGAGGVWGSNNGVDFFNAWFHGRYDDAARIAHYYQILTPQPLRQWRYAVDKEKQGEAKHWETPGFADAGWKTTDVAAETWSTLGLHNYFGRVWYRTQMQIPAAPAGRKTYLWLGGNDGRAKVFVNGQHVPYIDAKGNKSDAYEGFLTSASFDISSVFKPNAENQITILCERHEANDIGTGGLMGPVIVYRERA